MSFLKKTGENILDKGKKGGGFILQKSVTGGAKVLNGGAEVFNVVGNFIDKVGPVPLMKKSQ